MTIGNPFVVAGLPRCFSDEDVVERLDKLVRLAVCFGLLINFHLLLLCLTTGGHSQSSEFLSRCIQTDYYIVYVLLRSNIYTRTPYLRKGAATHI